MVADPGPNSLFPLTVPCEDKQGSVSVCGSDSLYVTSKRYPALRRGSSSTIHTSCRVGAKGQTSNTRSMHQAR